MREAPLTSVFDRWTHPSYERRVRGSTTPTYLWGSEGISNNISFDKALTLHIRNDAFGQPIQLSTTTLVLISATSTTAATTNAVTTEVGRLLPGECVSIQVQNISGVSAICVPPPGAPLESMVACIIRE
jgi:hypothetical protein